MIHCMCLTVMAEATMDLPHGGDNIEFDHVASNKLTLSGSP
jgi:hypothetical protein